MLNHRVSVKRDKGSGKDSLPLDYLPKKKHCFLWTSALYPRLLEFYLQCDTRKTLYGCRPFSMILAFGLCGGGRVSIR